MSDDLAARLAALEMRIAHQDATIEDLSAVITAQWTKIDALTRQLASLDDRMQDTEARTRAGETHAPPPHY